MTDTSPEIADLIRSRLMAKTGTERFLMGVSMHEAARRMVLASFPTTLTPQMLRHQLRERFYGPPISKEEALKKGMEEKSKEFVEKGAEVYTTA